MAPRPRPVEERFWALVDTNGPGCWEWQGTKDVNGYGKYKYPKHATGAHRVSWMLTHGPIPTGMVVMHLCDNPGCVNPRHLRLGTQGDNVADAMRKGRHQKGELNGRAKLTAEQIVEIRRIYETSDIPKVRLAARYGISPKHLRSILNGVNWGHVM